MKTIKLITVIFFNAIIAACGSGGGEGGGSALKTSYPGGTAFTNATTSVAPTTIATGLSFKVNWKYQFASQTSDYSVNISLDDKKDSSSAITLAALSFQSPIGFTNISGAATFTRTNPTTVSNTQYGGGMYSNVSIATLDTTKPLYLFITTCYTPQGYTVQCNVDSMILTFN